MPQKESSKPGPPNTTGSGPVRLRQIALVARDLQKAKDVLTQVLGVEVLYVDPEVGRWGLENFLVPVGGDVIEVVSPIKSGTAAGRTLDRLGGDGGYMLIMQHPDAQKRREMIEEKGLARVIFSSKGEEYVGVQYHPKGIQGGVIPELASHKATDVNPTPLQTRFSPWYACGPDESSYLAGMKRASHLSLLGAVCRISASEGWKGEAAASQWEQIFGVPRNRDLIAFTNARVGFIHGEKGKREGIVSISIGVKNEKQRREIFERAEQRGLVDGDRGTRWVEMVGVRWFFTLTSNEGSSKL